MEKTIAYIALGSNLGDGRRNLDLALERLAEVEGIKLLRRSAYYQTKAEGLEKKAPDFYNGVVEIETSLTPPALLNHLLQIEESLGRRRGNSNQPESRTIDLDILLYGELIVDSPDLHIPHPRMNQRWFVLKPLSDLCPHCRLPGCHETVQQALDRVEHSQSLYSRD